MPLGAVPALPPANLQSRGVDNNQISQAYLNSSSSMAAGNLHGGNQQPPSQQNIYVYSSTGELVPKFSSAANEGNGHHPPNMVDNVDAAIGGA